jgi:hypothetical protein
MQEQNNKYQVLHKYSYSSWWWTWRGPKHVEVINKIDEIYWVYCAPSWFHLQDYIEMHGQQNIQFTCLWTWERRSTLVACNVRTATCVKVKQQGLILMAEVHKQKNYWHMSCRPRAVSFISNINFQNLKYIWVMGMPPKSNLMQCYACAKLSDATSSIFLVRTVSEFWMSLVLRLPTFKVHSGIKNILLLSTQLPIVLPKGLLLPSAMFVVTEIDTKSSVMSALIIVLY